MDEPSVLDYVKAKLTFWKKVDIQIPADTGASPVEYVAQPVDAQGQSVFGGFTRLPWLLFLPFGLAFIGQLFAEQPDRDGLRTGITFLLAAVAAGYIAITGRINLAEAKPDLQRVDGLGFRRWLVLVGFVALFLAFLLFGKNRFTATNLLVWLFSLAMLVAAFLVDLDWSTTRERVLKALSWFRNPTVHFTFTPWMALVLLACLVVAFFRFSDLYGLPLNMVSDHAEKLYDVQDVLNGQYSIFFERNTGREPFQFYWTAWMALIFKTGVSFMSLKIGTVITGLITLYFLYRLGDEIGGKKVALYALFFAGIAYWANIISRIGLRFPLYPFCVAPVMFYLMRGLRTNRRNDFIWAGLWLGIGLHGYTASRIVPGLVIVAILLYVLHRQSEGRRKQTLVWGALLLFLAFAIFIPLFRYAVDNPTMFNYRSLTRLYDVEQEIPGNPLLIFLSNTWNALRMFFWSDGDVWVHSIPYRPALDVVSAGLFLVGAVLLLVRYIKALHWRDLFLLVSIPILMLPSILSIAFPNENPNLNRTAGAYVPVFLVVALGFDALLNGIRSMTHRGDSVRGAVIVGLILAGVATMANYQLFFKGYRENFDRSAWNTEEMGKVMRAYSQSVGSGDTAYVVGYPYWVDTRLVGINAGFPQINPEIMREMIPSTAADPRAKLFLLNPEDADSLALLRELYPDGWYEKRISAVPGKDFLIFNVPAKMDMVP